MSESARKAEFLAGKRVAFTGRLAVMTRVEAAELVRAHGGRFVPAVNQNTAYLVVGSEGWPLQKNGRLTAKLQRARRLERAGHFINILPEDYFLDRLGLASKSEGVRRLYSTNELTKLLKIPRDRLRSWLKWGLIRPDQSIKGVHFFDYSQVVGARTLCDLAEAGIRPEQIRRSLAQLQRMLPGVAQPLAQLAILERNGSLTVRTEDGLVETDGQRLLDFEQKEDTEELEAVPFPVPQDVTSAPEWFELGCEHEDAGRLPQAAEAYRQALLSGGPDADTSFNLANVLYAMGYKTQAVERYYQALELDRRCANAWVNLGVALSDLKCRTEARTAFQSAVECDPNNAEARYNLADLLDELGREEEALVHWQAYARLDPSSRWATHAHERIRRRRRV